MIIKYHKHFTRGFERLPLKLQNATQEAIRKFEKNPIRVFNENLCGCNSGRDNEIKVLTILKIAIKIS